MRILCNKTCRIAHPKPYLPQQLLCLGRVYDSAKGEIDHIIAQRAIELGFAEDISDATSALETFDDNAQLDTAAESIGDSIEAEEIDEIDEAEEIDEIDEIDEIEESEEVEETETSDAKKPSITKKIIRRKN